MVSWIELKKLEDGALKTTYRLNKIESDEDIVRREFLFGKLREIDRRIVKVEDELKIVRREEKLRRAEKNERNDSTSGDN